MSVGAQETMPVIVNGVGITDKQINTELQYHPAREIADARTRAMRALVVRELLLQEAQNKGVFKDRQSIKDESGVIETLLQKDIQVPSPDHDSCLRYYKNNQQRFMTSVLYEASHILLSAPADDGEKRAQALQKITDILAALKQSPDLFAALAREHSACSSAKEGGRLGQISKGQTTLEFEQALFKMKKGDISPSSVATKYGYHIIFVHERADSMQLPFEAVKDWIADYLKQSVWRRAVSQYIEILAGKADIKGFNLKAAETPLVQ